MGAMKELAIQGAMHSDIWTIGPRNPYVGRRMRVTWLKPWGGKPAGYSVEGVLKNPPFAVRGRVLIGDIYIQGFYGQKVVSAPWSRRGWIDIQLLD